MKGGQVAIATTTTTATVSTSTRSEIENKVELYDKTKERIIEKISGYITKAHESLKSAEEELKDAVESEFEQNPFADLLAGINSGIRYTDDEIETILSRSFPDDFGPNEESFCSLISEIESFRSCTRKRKRMRLDMIPQNVRCTDIKQDSIALSWDDLNFDCYYEIELGSLRSMKDIFHSFEPKFTLCDLKPGTEYHIRIRAVTLQNDNQSIWSNPIIVKTEQVRFECDWKECPDNVDEENKYHVDKSNPRIATKTDGDIWGTLIGDAPLPPSKVTSWSVKILESRDNDGDGILIGVAPSDINQNDGDNSDKHGWYFYCYSSTLCSGPPHNYNYDKDYGPRKEEEGEYVHTGDVVGVVMDTMKGILSFAINGASLGVAYEGIPLDKPLVPCVLANGGDSFELSFSSEATEIEVDKSIPTPLNITAKSTSWDTITITWDAVEGASLYQIETDKSKLWSTSTINTFTKKGLLARTKHAFRVRAIVRNSASKWSNITRITTLKAQDFSRCVWRECSYNVHESRRYSVDEENPKVATRTGFYLYSYCTIIGSTHIPLYEVVSWSIELLNSYDGRCIYVGVAPFDIDPNEDNYDKCGWYLNCHSLDLWSGPPYNYRGIDYVPKKKLKGHDYIEKRVGVVMDTTSGELSFIANGVNYGTAFKDVPLDKPLVPCVLLEFEYDSIKLDLSEVKENIDGSISVPPNISTKSIIWDSITITWDSVEGASFYQIEIDGSKSWYVSKSSTFAKRKLLPDTEYYFRVRTVKGNSVSGWSDIIKERTQKESFKSSWWKEHIYNAYEKEGWSVDENNPRIATNICDYVCIVMGNTSLPPNKVTSWSIRILESKYNDGNSIYIGIAPSDINQDVDYDYDNGWYFYCYDSTLCSGPPHNYEDEEYGPRKKRGKYVHTGDNVGVVMDTTNGRLLFVLNGVNLDIAYKGIPLDKPLVPCVIFENENDSVEFNPSSKVKKNKIDSSVPIPSNISTKSITWDSITLTWDAVERASLYQIEVDGNKLCDTSTINIFTKIDFLANTLHNFRIRAMRGTLASKWSDAVRERTHKKSFKRSRWNEYPDDVDEERKYYIHNTNPTIAISINNSYCTIIGNTSLPFNKKTSWNNKIAKSKDNGKGIYIGVAPFDINQKEDKNYKKCGWYFGCYHSKLYSGPPHNYKGKEYGSIKMDGEYVHTGDNVGVVIDTANGELSFILHEGNLGVAFEGIPLDKPLVPCVLLKYEGDSVELDTSEISIIWKNYIPVPSNIMAKNATCDSVTLTWNVVEGASSYQVEIDGSKLWDASATNTFTRKGLLSGTEHCFRVCTVKGSETSEWSDVIRIKTKLSFPRNIITKSITWDSITLTWDSVESVSFYQIEIDGNRLSDTIIKNTCLIKCFLPNTEHIFRVRTLRESEMSEWSDIVKERTQKRSFETSAWKECPDNVDENRKYSIDDNNQRIATKLFSSCDYCTIIGNTLLPLNKVTSWSIKILKSKSNIGGGINIGVAPHDINQDENYIHNEPKWNFNCYDSTLWSGPPHNYKGKEYGPRKEYGNYVHTGDSVGVIMDTTKGELSFILSEVNYGVAYQGISLDKPLVPCIILGNESDSVELDTSEVSAFWKNYIPTPSNIVVKNTTFDSITLAWDAVNDASFYRVEADGNSSWRVSAINVFTFKGLLSDTDHSFRVRTVKGNEVSEWSDIVKGRTQERTFETSAWKECPDNVDEKRKYSIDDNNQRIATKLFNSCDYCTIIGNTPLPFNKITSWNIKILKSKMNTGGGINIGVAPLDINQNDDNNYYKHGWYFYCNSSLLWSGPPHNYEGKKYGPRKEYGEYVHTGDSIGVVMDTAKGDLSFVLSEVNYGIAYEGIPLDKPLVPCALLRHMDDSVELDTSKVNVNWKNYIPVPSNIIVKNVTCGSITLTWDAVNGASSYQIEVDGNKQLYTPKMNSFAIRGLLPDTEHCFRIRTVKGDEVSEWSDVVRVKTNISPPKNIIIKTTTLDSITLAWDAVEGASFYRVEADGNKQLYTPTTNSFTFKGFLPDTEHCFRIRTVKESGKSEWSDAIRVKTNISPPTNVGTNSVTWESITLYWNDVANNSKELVTYNVEMKSENEKVFTKVYNGTKRSFTKRRLLPDTEHCFRVRTVRGSEVSEWSDIMKIKTNISPPKNIVVKSTTFDSIILTWDKVDRASSYSIEVSESKFWGVSKSNSFTKKELLPDTVYHFKVRTVRGSKMSEWSNIVKGRTQKMTFEESGWKECSDNIDEKRKYLVDAKSPKIASNISDCCCTVIGNAPLPLNKVNMWSIKISNSIKSDGRCIFIGIAPSDIYQNEWSNSNKCGWYLNCFYSTLWSGPPHSYNNKEYGPRKKEGNYVHTGDSVGVVMDTAKGELSFVLSRVILDVAYEGIPLDKPLVPCVLLWYKGDSVELDTSDVSANWKNYIHVPSNIIVKNVTCGSITLTWDAVNGASSYRVEINGSKPWNALATNTFTRRGLLPDTEYCFRVCIVKGSEMSEWSDVIRARTKLSSPKNIIIKTTTFDSITLTWDIVEGASSYQVEVDGNKQLYTSTTNSFALRGFLPDTEHCFRACTVKGSETSEWSDIVQAKTKILSPRNIIIKATTFDSITLTWDAVEGASSYQVEMDGNKRLYTSTTNSFALRGFLPDTEHCFRTRTVKGNETSEWSDIMRVKTNISPPKNIIIKTTTLDSITLTWDAVEGASFYRVEADGNSSWRVSAINVFTFKGLFSDTEHCFRVCTVKGSEMSEWSDTVNGRTHKLLFEYSWWKEYPDGVNEEKNYLVNIGNPRIVTKIGNAYRHCAIMGNTFLPLNRVTSWSIKILNSKDNNGNSIYIGVTPSGISQNENNNSYKRGWYFDCYNSTLCSGPPHNYNNKEYGPRKTYGNYVHIEDSVGVVMDTTKGDLSFVLSRANYGVAYEGIPLDKPLVPCVILYNNNDSVELDPHEIDFKMWTDENKSCIIS